jgi:hypothetical protein
MTNEQEEAIQAVITARDFCGNEKQAVAQVEADNDIEFTSEEKRFIVGQADRRWNESRQVAGVVNPLSQIDRERAFAALA